MTTQITAAPTSPVSRRRRHTPLLWSVVRSPVRIFKFFFSRRTPWGPKLLSLFALAYVIWPVDLIPDVAPLLGWLDDAGMVTLALGWVLKKVSEMDEPPPAEDQTEALTSS